MECRGQAPNRNIIENRSRLNLCTKENSKIAQSKLVWNWKTKMTWEQSTESDKAERAIRQS